MTGNKLNSLSKTKIQHFVFVCFSLFWVNANADWLQDVQKGLGKAKDAMDNISRGSQQQNNTVPISPNNSTKNIHFENEFGEELLLPQIKMALDKKDPNIIKTSFEALENKGYEYNLRTYRSSFVIRIFHPKPHRELHVNFGKNNEATKIDSISYLTTTGADCRTVGQLAMDSMVKELNLTPTKSLQPGLYTPFTHKNHVGTIKLKTTGCQIVFSSHNVQSTNAVSHNNQAAQSPMTGRGDWDGLHEHITVLKAATNNDISALKLHLNELELKGYKISDRRIANGGWLLAQLKNNMFRTKYDENQQIIFIGSNIFFPAQGQKCNEKTKLVILTMIKELNLKQSKIEDRFNYIVRFSHGKHTGTIVGGNHPGGVNTTCNIKFSSKQK